MRKRIVACQAGAWVACAAGIAFAAPQARNDAFSRAILADVRQLVADYNAESPHLASHYAADQVLMTSGEPNVVGAAAAKEHREHETKYKVTLAISDIVIDAAASRDIAVVRSTCVITIADRTTKAVLQTRNDNCVMGYKRQMSGQMKVNWAITSATAPDPK